MLRQPLKGYPRGGFRCPRQVTIGDTECREMKHLALSCRDSKMTGIVVVAREMEAARAGNEQENATRSLENNAAGERSSAALERCGRGRSGAQEWTEREDELVESECYSRYHIEAVY